jgi:outer membrane protein
MWKTLFGAALALLTCLAPRPSLAQSVEGLAAGSFLLRGRVVGVIPNHGGTTIKPIGGYIDDSNTVSPEIDLSYFFTDHLAMEGEIGVLQQTLTAVDTRLGTVPIGRVSSVPIILMGQYHFRPHARLNPYLGIGIAITPYYDVEAAGGRIQQLSVTSEVGAAFQMGVDYQVQGPWYANFDVKKLLLSAKASANDGMVSASGQVNPWVIGAGIGYRF